jgi:hypothetical protein
MPSWIIVPYTGGVVDGAVVETLSTPAPLVVAVLAVVALVNTSNLK